MACIRILSVIPQISISIELPFTVWTKLTLQHTYNSRVDDCQGFSGGTIQQQYYESTFIYKRKHLKHVTRAITGHYYLKKQFIVIWSLRRQKNEEATLDALFKLFNCVCWATTVRSEGSLIDTMKNLIFPPIICSKKRFRLGQ